MTQGAQTGNVPCEEIQLLTFTIMGTRLGVDASQISEMFGPEQAIERGIDVRRFNDEIPFKDGPVVYTSPMVLLIKNEIPQYGILIDQPDDIRPVSLNTIRPLPPLMSSCKGPKAIWGAAIKEDEVVLLVDFYRLGADHN